MVVAEVAERSGEALEEFEALLAPLLGAGYQLAAGMVADPAEAQDVLQEASVRAWKRFPTLRDRSAFRSWFFTIVANQSRSSVRRQRRAALLSSVFHLRREEAVPNLLDDALVVRSALAQLRLHHREVVVLHYLMGMSPEQIAEQLHVPPGTVKSRLNRALLTLRLFLGEANNR